MKKPEDIKRGLECCCKAGYQAGGCKDCPYKSEPVQSCSEVMGNDAKAYIKQLEEGIEQWELVAASPGAVEDMGREIARLEERCERLLRTAEMLNDALREYQRRDGNV